MVIMSLNSTVCSDIEQRVLTSACVSGVAGRAVAVGALLDMATDATIATRVEARS